MTDTTEKVIDTAADVVGEVKDHAEEIEQAIRALNKMRVKYYAIGMTVGGAIGAVVAFRVAYKKAELKYEKIADTEIAEMRQHYREKRQALEAEVAKRPLSEIVEEQGYSSTNAKTDTPPMAIQPPSLVMAKDEENEQTEEEAPEVRNIFKDAEVTHEWDYQRELRNRTPDAPYVIHYDERHEMQGYTDVTLTWYELDNVVANDDDEVMDPDERDSIIGRETLNRFGHGSNDAAIVFVRNDKLEIIFEICRSPNSFAEEVHGFSHEDLAYGNLERMRSKERDERED